MNIVILGAGEIGRHIAESLAKTSARVVVIERDKNLVHELDGVIDGKIIGGCGSMVDVLIKAQADECDLFMALTSDTGTNLVACSSVKRINNTPGLRVIARSAPLSPSEEAVRRVYGIDNAAHFEIDYIFSSERLVATELEKYIRNPSSLQVLEIAGGDIEMQRVSIAGGSKADGSTLRQLELVEGVRAVAVHRENRYFVPKADDILEPGDEITLFGNQTNLKQALTLFDRRKRETHPRVVIFGGGEYGVTLANKLLAWDNRVTLLDRDPRVCARLSDELSGATVLLSDATSLQSLKEADVGSADYFVATTQSDEDNVMTCLQAHDLGPVTCLTLIHRADYAKVLSGSGTRLGIKAAISPREATLSTLQRFVNDHTAHKISEFSYGGQVHADLIETVVAANSAIAGKRVCDIDWPENCIVVGRARGNSAKLPSATETLEAGDNIFVMLEPKSIKSFMKLAGR